MVLREFNNFPITFKHNGVSIHGIINGSITDWVFNSNDQLFLKYFPDGRMINRFSFKQSDLDYDSFISSFYKVADKLINS